MRFILKMLLLCMILCFCKEADAKCRLQFRGLANNQSMIVDASMISRLSQSQIVNFIIENTGTSACYYFVTSNQGLSGDIAFNRQAKITHALPAMFQNVNRDSISYQLYSQSITDVNILTSLDQAVFEQNVVGPRKIEAGQTVSDGFIVHLPSQELPNLIAESYDDDVVLTLYQNEEQFIDFANDCPTCSEEDSLAINLQFPMQEYVTLSLGKGYNPNTRQAFLDFGEIESNKQEAFDVYVGGRTDGGGLCSVTISSENGSKLVRRDIEGVPERQDEVLYTVQAQSGMGNPIVLDTIDLSTPNKPVTLATSSEPFICGNNSQGVMSVNVSITIGDVAEKNAGIYRDIILIEALIGL